MQTPIIILDKVSKIFQVKKPGGLLDRSKSSNRIQHNKLVALNNISFSIPKGEILGIIGDNGSGKTTLLRTIAGIYPPDSGSVVVNGKIAPILHLGTGFQKELSAQDNIIMYGLPL